MTQTYHSGSKYSRYNLSDTDMHDNWEMRPEPPWLDLGTHIIALASMLPPSQTQPSFAAARPASSWSSSTELEIYWSSWVMSSSNAGWPSDDSRPYRLSMCLGNARDSSQDDMLECGMHTWSTYEHSCTRPYSGSVYTGPSSQQPRVDYVVESSTFQRELHLPAK